MSEFDALLEAADRGPGCGIRLPFDPRAELGSARAPVRVWIDDAEPFPTRVMVYAGQAWIGLRKDQRAELGIGPGDTVRVRVERDDEPRTVDVPPELTDALREAADAAAVFEALSYTHRKEYAGWVGEAKREETRHRRAEKAVTMLRSGVRHP